LRFRHWGGPVEGLEHAGLGRDGEILFLPVAFDESTFDATDDRLNERGIRDQHVNILQGIPVKQLSSCPPGEELALILLFSKA
jgi:hypothetical protein